MSTTGRIALFLDFENLVTNTGISASNFDLHPALDRLLEKGKVVYRRAYCDWTRFKDAKSTLHELGVELIDVPPSTRAGKNAADMRLVIDALELCYARGHIDTFVIASGDSDFCPLAYKLRENDKTVIGLAVREATSQLFVKACDEFIYLKPAGHKPREEKPSSGHGRGPRKSHGRSGEKEKHGAAAAAAASAGIPEVAREVVRSLLASATAPLNPSFLKETIVRKQPDFDERDYGFSTFSRMLAELEKEGVLKRQQSGRQWYVVPVDHPVAPSPGGGHSHAKDAHAEEELEEYPDPDSDM